MEPCYYHPEAKAKSTCAECTMAICDRCRLDGDMQRCASCAAFYQEGGAPEATAVVPQAAPVDDYSAPMCTNHSTLAADMQCLNCFRPFCLSCASTGYCPDCAPQFVSKQNAAASQMAANAGVEAPYAENYAPQEFAQPGYEQAYEEPADGGGFDLAGSYLDDSPAPARRPRKRPADPGAGAKKPPVKPTKKPAKKGGGVPMGAIAGAVVAVLALAGGGYWYMSHGASAPGDGGEEAAAPMKISITSPKTGKLKGAQVIKLKVTSPDTLDHVELQIDGKYWGKFKEAPFESDWPTGIFKNGKHKVLAKAFYKGGKTVAETHEYTIENPN
ncbi:MAG: hypothetical protein JWM80_3167 [Cyanobacteria bacterium RYN_339]|nr:hypothetical protein [Cyanobacteria bacterium RYN_339]